jgi:hypothetical protein
MSSNNSPERLSLTIEAEQANLVLTIGDVAVAVTLPLPAGHASMAADKLQAAIKSNARRALEIARTELEQA